MAELVSTIEQVLENIETLYLYGESANERERRFHNARIKNGKLFAVMQVHDSFRFAPSKFAGYLDNDISHASDLAERDGRKTNIMLSRLFGDALEPGDEGYDAIDQGFLTYCDRKGIVPSEHHRERRYWLSGPASAEKPTADPKELSESVARALKRIRSRKPPTPEVQHKVP